MKSIICTKYGPPEVLEYREVESPKPKGDEVLIRNHATTVTAGDSEIRGFHVQRWLWLPIRLWVGLVRPRGKGILGTEFAGIVEAAGKDTEEFKPGDRVFGSMGFNFGANAEYIAVQERGDLSIIPEGMSFAEAVALPFGGRDALHFLKKGNLRPGNKVLVIGAGGSIGTFAVQLAKLNGAVVTGVDSEEKLEMVSSIGADRVIDFSKESYLDGEETYDIVFDTVGKSPFFGTLGILNKKGSYLLANPTLTRMLLAPWITKLTGKKVITAAAEGTREDLDYLAKLAAEGKIRALIDKSYPLERIAEAHRYIETGRKKGNVVITV